MEAFWDQVTAGGPGAPQTVAESQTVAEDLRQAIGADEVYWESVCWARGAILALARRGLEKSLLVAMSKDHLGQMKIQPAEGWTKKAVNLSVGPALILERPPDDIGARALREWLPWTGPQLIGDRPSIGLGDRLGLATPGHVRAVRDTGYVPMLAQQSVREMTRTDRSPHQVMDDATWGVFQTGFREGFGADADHLKTFEDIDSCAAVGFTFYTIDPGDHVEDAADEMEASALAEPYAALPWDTLRTTPEETLERFVGETIELTDEVTVAFDEATLHRAAVKYGRAVAHTASMFGHLKEVFGDERFELEVSVDETESPTTPAEHYYVARELARLGVAWISLAPRFVGRFEKGVDYIGDLDELERTFRAHLAIADAFGGYKISLHSGSDKFSVYEMAARHGGERVHVKTAGTSYLEALRVIAGCEPALFREVLAFDRNRYETDKATYHVSANLANVPEPDELADEELPALLDQFDARQVMHVTFGSVLTAEGGQRFRRPLIEALKTHEREYEAALEKHIGRHVGPFVGST